MFEALDLHPYNMCPSPAVNHISHWWPSEDTHTHTCNS